MRAVVKGVVATVAATGLAAGGYALYESNMKPVKPTADSKQDAAGSHSQQDESIHSLPHAADVQAFEEFMATYRKSYDTEAEKMGAFKTFVKNLRLIESHNAKKGSMAKLAVNAFADIEPEHFKASKLGLRNKAADERKKFYNNLGVFRSTGVAVPTEVDWRTKGAVTPVKNQGESYYFYFNPSISEPASCLSLTRRHRWYLYSEQLQKYSHTHSFIFIRFQCVKLKFSRPVRFLLVFLDHWCTGRPQRRAHGQPVQSERAAVRGLRHRERPRVQRRSYGLREFVLKMKMLLILDDMSS